MGESNPKTELPTLKLPADVCRTAASLDREWLVTNGIGGYASGTVGGALSRRYHGWLIAATDPPAVRTLLLAKLEETLIVQVGDSHESHRLGADKWQSGAIDPSNFSLLDCFWLEGITPCWRFKVGASTLERRIAMVPGRNATLVQYRIPPTGEAITLVLRALVNRRDHHHLRTATPPIGAARSGWTTGLGDSPGQVRVCFGTEIHQPETSLYLICPESSATPESTWWRDWLLCVERDRGYDFDDNHLHAATFTIHLRPGDTKYLLASSEEIKPTDVEALWARQLSRQSSIAAAGIANTPASLVMAADQFVVKRTTGSSSGFSIIAGYHWFADWGRDSLISLPGILLATGRTAEAASLLRTWGGFLQDGLLPNRFPDSSEVCNGDSGRASAQLERNSVDAPLLYISAVHRLWRATGDLSVLRSLLQPCADVCNAFMAGTRHGIGVDPSDGLVHAGESGLQLTWMDAKVGDLVVTPRSGKPIEVNALWYHALRSMTRFCAALGTPSKQWESAATKTAAHMYRFWDEDLGYCCDVLDGAGGHDRSLRPNQLFAVGLPDSALPPTQQTAVVRRCLIDLWTPRGVRTLSPSDREYRGNCEGNQMQRDLAYHQGTAWPWLLGVISRAHLRVNRDVVAARALSIPCLEASMDGCSPTVGEIADGDFPHCQRGCIAQAWSVGELLDILSPNFSTAYFEDLGD